jgi:hypothetical protein
MFKIKRKNDLQSDIFPLQNLKSLLDFHHLSEIHNHLSIFVILFPLYLKFLPPWFFSAVH